MQIAQTQLPTTVYPILRRDMVAEGVTIDQAFSLLDLIAPGNIAVRRYLTRRTRRPKATETRLSKRKSEEIARLERLWRHVFRVYNNDKDAAREFLARPHLMLNNQPPLDFALVGETNALFLHTILSTIEFGFAV